MADCFSKSEVTDFLNFITLATLKGENDYGR